MEKKILAAFDFDGTITKGDTLPSFIRFAVSKKQLFLGTLIMVPYLLLFKLKLIPNFKAKEKLFKTFFSGLNIHEFNRLSALFALKIELMIRKEAIERIKWHQSNGDEVIIISASVENWIKPWAFKYGIKTILATRLELQNDIITGNFLTKNCHGREKVIRLLDQYSNRESYVLYAYGDSNGDKDLLEVADFSFYRRFADKI